MSSANLKPTGERLLPDHYRGQLSHAEHLARYHLAVQLAPGRRVLDAACGEGYGTALLAAAGAEAVGVDIDDTTVEHVRRHHRVDAQVADVAALPFEDGSFDLVVSFETIEHVDDPERALDELARVRAPDGHVLISTPNATEYLVQNEFHVREFGHDEFVDLLRERFTSVRVLYQHNWLTSAILDEEAMATSDGRSAVELDLAKVKGVRPGGELYMVALCGDDTGVPLRATGVMAGTDEAHLLAHRLDDALRTQQRLNQDALDAHRRFEDIRATARWMRSTWSWRLTKPFRLHNRLRRRR